MLRRVTRGDSKLRCHFLSRAFPDLPLIPLESHNRHLFNGASGKSGNNGADQRLSVKSVIWYCVI